ncbi:hypothetical protein [Falsigemmobacter faecalis]|uniref:Uncharacterized protein n=1 Tax=Falsigemmobacter faecalis TaxID=2488730 RepID=A0A3P3DG46_9RHOB|nr:hypothetical protein [Falsigemmobacter faecalis]RRH72814.1 hypothetical protein EG244_14175 [Falsigemmobacter faecalis]
MKPSFPLSRRILLGSAAAAGLTALLPATARAEAGYWSPLRSPSGPRDRSVHSGHSLTDSYLNTGPWPGSLRRMADSMGLRDAERKIVKSTIPGAPLSWRWDHSTDPGSDARHDIAGFQTLVITEGGPPPRIRPDEQTDMMAHSLDYLCRFAANALQNGNKGEGLRDINLWSIWPSLNLWRPPGNPDWQEFADFRSALPEYGRSFEFMAAYATWKMRSHFKDLPDDWRIRVFPGHLWMARAWDAAAAGEIPGITRFEEFFVDEIHANDVCGYGLACLVLSCLYQKDLGARQRLFRMEGISPELRDWFTRTAWEVASDYAPAGMGGSSHAGLLWDPERMKDPLPDWHPPGPLPG